VKVEGERAAGVAYCEKCGGVFADVAATKRIVSTLDRALLEIGFQAGLGRERKHHPPREISCPECLIAMQQQRIEAAACVVDVCPVHGTWFDTGELEDVMRAFARARKHGAHVPGAAPVAHDPPLVEIKRGESETPYASGAGNVFAASGRGLFELLLSLLKS
jgi:Zn-finger nucleic acid-binding protein